MSIPSDFVSIHPYFKVNAGQLDAFKAMLPRFVEKTAAEKDCIHYCFTVNDDVIHCREGYAGAAGLLAHLENVGALLGEALKISSLERLEVHGPAGELEKLKEPMAALDPAWFVHECGLK